MAAILQPLQKKFRTFRMTRAYARMKSVAFL